MAGGEFSLRPRPLGVSWWFSEGGGLVGGEGVRGGAGLGRLEDAMVGEGRGQCRSLMLGLAIGTWEMNVSERQSRRRRRNAEIALGCRYRRLFKGMFLRRAGVSSSPPPPPPIL